MATITLYPTSNGSIAHSVVGGGTAYGALADNNDSTYIRYVATKNEEVKTSTFNIGTSTSISGRFVVTGIQVVSRTKKGYNSMDTASVHSNLYVGGIEGSSWGLDLSTSWTDRSHTSSVSEFSNLNGKALTSLPGLVLHLQSTTKVKTTGDNKYVGFSRAYVTLTYTSLYSQSAQGSTGVTASLSNDGSTVQGYYKSESKTTYTATLSSGYGFKGWFTNSSGTGTAVSTSLSYTETCNSDRTLYAIAFAVSAQGSTGVTASVSRGTDGRTFTFSASLSTNYAFDGWYNGSTRVSQSLSYSPTLSQETTLTAKAFSVSYSGDSGVTVEASRSSDGRSYTFTGTLSSTSTSASTLNVWVLNGTTQSETTATLTSTIEADTTVTVSSYTTTISKDSGVNTATISRSTDRSVTISLTLKPGYDFDGWYVNNVKTISTTSSTITPTSSLTYTAKTIHHVYSLALVADSYSSGTITTSDYYYGTTATFSATITNDKYLFVGWYNDSGLTDLYSSSQTTTYVITGDKTLYIKTKPKKRIFWKVNGVWQEIPKVYVKINGIWTLIEPDDYVNVFHTDVKYIKGN